MGSRIESVTIGIAARSVPEAARWYKSLLGDLEMLEAAPGVVELRLREDTWLQLDDTGYLEAGGRSSIVRLGTQDIEAAHRTANSLAPDVEAIVTVEGVVKYFDFKDPAGNRLSFVQLL